MRVYFGRSLSFFTPRCKFSLEIIFFSTMPFFLILGLLKSRIYEKYVKLLLGKFDLMCIRKNICKIHYDFFSLQATLVSRCLLHIDQKKKKNLRYLRLNFTSFNQEYRVEIVLWLKYVPTYLVTLYICMRLNVNGSNSIVCTKNEKVDYEENKFIERFCECSFLHQKTQLCWVSYVQSDQVCWNVL